ncbi:Rv3235 family protein [Kribbella sp. DT2]|uniref:Rv3235 family protein n=1 Tax=Kribbella sp. DT2 TaxID=3393427 RepID=UPI003CF5BD90
MEVQARPVLRLVPAGPAVPDVRDWAARLVQAIAETVGGDRPVSQLLRWTDTAVYVDVHRRVRLLGLTTTAGKRAAKGRSAVRSVHVCQPDRGVAEVAAHLRTGGRSRAMALRLEIRRGRWVCTALELG